MRKICRIIPLTCAALLALAILQTDASAQAKGMDVTEVRIAASGVAPEVIYRQSAAKTWQVISGGRVTGTCDETGRDEWSVYLACAENVKVMLNLFRKERRITGNTGSTLTSPIASASNAPIGAGSLSQMSIDAALFVATENASYLFQGDHYYRLTAGTKVDPNYPMKLPGEWKGLQPPFTSGIDAAVQDPYSKTIYFFKGNEYAAINAGNKTVIAGYSNVKLPGGWQGLPASFFSGIDAALDDNGSIILYKGSRQIVIKNEKFVNESAVPASVLAAGPINAAFKFSNGRNYFFSGEKVARASGFAVDGGWPYPIKDVWAGVNGGTAPTTTATTTAATTAATSTPTAAPTTATRSATAPAPRAPLSPNELEAVMRWISVKTSAERLPFCWRQSYGNTVGKPMVCQAGYEESSPGICSQNCQAGERGIATFCYKNCPTGFRDDGLYCGKPASYTRGAGYVIWDQAICEKQNPQGCEQAGAIWYPKCKQNFHGVVTDCSPDCPQGWEDIGVSCKKPSRFRDTKGLSVCPAGMEKGPADLICYPKCRTDFEPRGPVCWQKCPSQQSFDCGAGCATSESQCTEAVFSMVSGPIRAALQIIAIAATAGGAAGANEAANVDKFARAAETVETLNDLVDAAEAIKDLVQNQSFQELLSDPNTAGATRAKIDEYSREFVEHFAEMTTNEVDRVIDKTFTNPAAANEVKRQWSLRHLSMMLEANGISTAKATLGVAAIGDPTGIADVINAFTHPVCKDNTPFPTIHPLY